MTGPDDPAWRWEFRCEDFVYARLADAQTTAEQMPAGAARDAELHRIDTLYLIASQHNIGMSLRGQSYGRCITCRPSDGGVPCLSMRGLARLWHSHPDYVPGWNDAVDRPESGSGYTYREYKQRSTIWTRTEAHLTAFYDRFDLHETDGGEYWQCKTCGTRGETETLNPYLEAELAQDLCSAAVYRDGPRKHPTCSEMKGPK